MSPKTDIYTKVHKGLRKALYDLSYSACRTNYSDDYEVENLSKLFDEVIRFLEEYIKNEKLFLLPLLEKKLPGSTFTEREKHSEIEAKIEILKRNFESLAASSYIEKKFKGEIFCQIINEFMTDYLNHMQAEELETTILIYEYCSYEELKNTLRIIISSISPVDIIMMLRYIIPALNTDERVELIERIKQTAPKPAFNAVIVLAQSVLDDDEWRLLQRSLSSAQGEEIKVWEAVA